MHTERVSEYAEIKIKAQEIPIEKNHVSKTFFSGPRDKAQVTTTTTTHLGKNARRRRRSGHLPCLLIRGRKFSGSRRKVISSWLRNLFIPLSSDWGLWTVEGREGWSKAWHARQAAQIIGSDGIPPTPPPLPYPPPIPSSPLRSQATRKSTRVREGGDGGGPLVDDDAVGQVRRHDEVPSQRPLPRPPLAGGKDRDEWMGDEWVATHSRAQAAPLTWPANHDGQIGNLKQRPPPRSPVRIVPPVPPPSNASGFDLGPIPTGWGMGDGGVRVAAAGPCSTMKAVFLAWRMNRLITFDAVSRCSESRNAGGGGGRMREGAGWRPRNRWPAEGRFHCLKAVTFEILRDQKVNTSSGGGTFGWLLSIKNNVKKIGDFDGF